MLSKGQGATMATYDCLLLAFDMDKRLDEAEMLWNVILHSHDRSISKRLFSRMISVYDHHNMPNKVIEVIISLILCLFVSYPFRFGSSSRSEAYLCLGILGSCVDEYYLYHMYIRYLLCSCVLELIFFSGYGTSGIC